MSQHPVRVSTHLFKSTNDITYTNKAIDQTKYINNPPADDDELATVVGGSGLEGYSLLERSVVAFASDRSSLLLAFSSAKRSTSAPFKMSSASVSADW